MHLYTVNIKKSIEPGTLSKLLNVAECIEFEMIILKLAVAITTVDRLVVS